MRDSANPVVLARTTRFLAVLVLLSGIAMLTGMHAPRVGAVEFSDDEQKIANLLPDGFSPSLCKTAIDPIPPLDAVASLQCTGSAAGGPTKGRFTLWPDAGTMSDQFQTQVVGSALWTPSPCPGVGASPANWHYTETSDQVAGSYSAGPSRGRRTSSGPELLSYLRSTSAARLTLRVCSSGGAVPVTPGAPQSPGCLLEPLIGLSQRFLAVFLCDQRPRVGIGASSLDAALQFEDRAQQGS